MMQDPAQYGENAAPFYDREIAHPSSAQIKLLTEAARGGPVLELAVGTGRVSLPLVRQGLDVHGLDISPAMLDVLRQKDGADSMILHLGDMACFSLGVKFSLIILVLNGLFFLPTQSQQRSLFASVEEHLAPGGCFILETDLPSAIQWQNHQLVTVRDVTADAVELEFATHDPWEQTVEMNQMNFASTGISRVVAMRLRYAHPSEIDLMASAVGLELVRRWGGWRKASLTRRSTRAVSVYARQSASSA